MTHQKDLETLLSQSLDDRRLSRAERQVLGQLLSSQTPSPANAARIQHRALQLAKSALTKSSDNDILVWFHDVSKVINQWRYEQQEKSIAHTDFSPSNEPRARIIGLINDAQKPLIAAYLPSLTIGLPTLCVTPTKKASKSASSRMTANLRILARMWTLWSVKAFQFDWIVHRHICITSFSSSTTRFYSPVATTGPRVQRNQTTRISWSRTMPVLCAHLQKRLKPFGLRFLDAFSVVPNHLALKFVTVSSPATQVWQKTAD